jgi:hypothetical protein
MKIFWEFVMVLLVFAIATFIGYALYDAEKSMYNVGKSVVINGDSLEIVKWTQYGDLYVLSNGLIYHYENRN